MALLAVMMDGVLRQAGDLGAENDHLFSDRAFHYGDGLFETIAVIHGQALFWDAHLERLTAGAEILHIPVPPLTEWQAAFQRLVHDYAHHDRLVLKLILGRGSGMGYASQNAGPSRCYLSLSEWPQRRPDFWNPGMIADISPVPLLTGAPYLGVKSLNRLNQVMARDALSEDCAEGVMLDSDGILREGTMSNLFWVSGGVVHTPWLENGGIIGVQRDAILAWLRTQNIATRMGVYRSEVLRGAEEIFFSNSLIGIWPVRRFQGRALPGNAGLIASILLAWHQEMGLCPS